MICNKIMSVLFRINNLSVFVLMFFVVGCTTSIVPLKYEGNSSNINPINKPVIVVGDFIDKRPKKPNDLGVVRGGYGNVLKRLRTKKAIADVVEDVFREALIRKGLLAPDISEAKFFMYGVVNKLDCNYFFNKEAHAHLTIKLKNKKGRVVFVKQYMSDKTQSGIGAGIFASVEDLRKLAEETLDDAVNKVLNDPEFLAVVSEYRDN